MVAKYRIGRPKRPFKFGGPVLVHRLHMRKSGPDYNTYDDNIIFETPSEHVINT